MNRANQYNELHLQQLQLNINFLLHHFNKHPRLLCKREISNLLQRTQNHIESILPYVKNNFQLEVYIARLLMTTTIVTQRLYSHIDENADDTIDAYRNLQEELDKHNKEATKIISRFLSTYKLTTELHILQASHKSLMAQASQAQHDLFTSLLKTRTRTLFFILEAITHTQNAISQAQTDPQSHGKSTIEKRKMFWGHRQRTKVMAPSTRIPTDIFLMKF